MKKITKITKSQIKGLFKNGIDIGLGDSDYQYYLYWGRCENELTFLKRLYPLDKMPSNDSRYDNAEEDIIQHTINNDDWKSCWIFDDARFPLLNGTDEDYLKFLIEVFNPEVCVENYVQNQYYSKIQELLHKDGYELYVSEHISGKPVYSWRFLTVKEIKTTKFLPFSVRYEDELKTKTMKMPSIHKIDRRQIFDLMGRYEETCFLTSETGFNYLQLTKEAMWNEMKEHYIPKSFKNNNYIETDNIEDFILENYPQFVFDAVELYYLNSRSSLFEDEVNAIISKYGYKLVDKKIQLIVFFQVAIEFPQNDTSLRQLLQLSQSFVRENNSNKLQLAIEKIWDAFERIKTIYGTDKKKSLSELKEKVSGGSEEIAFFLEEEFVFLSKIGNKYQIRHFERGKKEFQSDEMKKYFYNRCASLVNLCISHLNNSDM